MGYANWNDRGCNYTDSTFRAIVSASVQRGASASHPVALSPVPIRPRGEITGPAGAVFENTGWGLWNTEASSVRETLSHGRRVGPPTWARERPRTPSARPAHAPPLLAPIRPLLTPPLTPPPPLWKADAFVSTGLAAAGYKTLLVQECIVPAGARDPVTHVVQPDPVKFPFGLANLADYFHSKGLLAGIYTDVAHLTCAGYEGSGPGPTNLQGHWPLDALTYAQWGFDLIEADFCNTGGLNFTALELYRMARDGIAAATAATGRVVALYACNWGAENPWEWAPEVANLFRNTGDICAPGSIAWGNIISNFDNTVVHSSYPPRVPGLPGTGVGAWNDPDMLGVGMKGITDTEGRSQFSLWCILGAPLFLGTDVLNMSPYTLATISNPLAIYIDQGADMQATEIMPGGAPTPFSGGLLLNLTTCGNTGTGWAINASAGQLVNLAAPDQCATVYACDNSPGSIVFSFECISNACDNEVWAVVGGEVQSKVDGASEALCLTGVDPATAPQSQLLVDTCDGRATQQWTVDSATGELRLASLPPASQCLALLTPPVVNLYSKTMRNGEVAVGVLNRGATAVPSQTVDLSLFSFAPAQGVMVTAVWANVTEGPFFGSFETRSLQSHETLLFLLSLAVGGPTTREL